MSEELVGPEESGLWVSVSTDRNDRSGKRMSVPEHLMDGVLEGLRTAAARRADYALNCALLKWQALATEVPNLLDRSSLEGVTGQVENALESLRVLEEMAPTLYEDDDGGGGDDHEPEPSPDPSASYPGSTS